MPDAGVSGVVGDVPGTTEPPIAILLPLLHLVLAGLSLLVHIVIQCLSAVAYPLRVVWSVAHTLLSPITMVVKITLDFMLFTPFSVISVVAVALYPVYVFCVAACIFGATIGIFGHYISTTILGILARSNYFIRPPSTPPAAPPSGPQVMLRKRKRKSVRLQ